MATLFLATGAAIITVLAGTGEHQLTSYFLSFLRMVMALLTVIAFASVLVLVSVRDQDTLWWYFIALGLLATPLATFVVAAWCHAGSVAHD
jgi:hypothetical protein